MGSKVDNLRERERGIDEVLMRERFFLFLLVLPVCDKESVRNVKG